MKMSKNSRIATFILAGGRGERLGPLTDHRAKPAVPFGDARIIDFTLSNCLRSGLHNPYILTQYHANSLHQHVRRWWRQNAESSAACASPVCVSSQAGAPYRGTADALLRNKELCSDADHVVVLSADHIYSMDYQELLRAHVAAQAAVTIGAIVSPTSSSRQFGVMQVDSTWRVHGFQEKPERPATLPGQPDKILASMGIYVFDAAVLTDALLRNAQDSGHDIGKDLLPGLVRSTPVHAFNFADPRTGAPRYWRDVGTLDSYYTTAMEWYGGSVISSLAVIHETAHISDSIVLPGVRIGRGALVRRAILDENVSVPAGARIGYDRHDASLFTVTPSGIVVVPANTSVPRGGRAFTQPQPQAVGA